MSESDKWRYWQVKANFKRIPLDKQKEALQGLLLSPHAGIRQAAIELQRESESDRPQEQRPDP